MNTITAEQIKEAINTFLTAQYHKKSEKEQKQLVKAEQENDPIAIAEAREALRPIQEKYQADHWFQAAEKMAGQLNFGTHTSKGIHSDAKGDNIIFSSSPAHGYIGTHSIDSTQLDASGNAAALPLAAFFEQPVSGSYLMRDVILAQLPALHGCFGTDSARSEHYQQVFYYYLTAQPDAPSTHERNKQILWAINPDENEYCTLVPLHPSKLTHEVYLNINHRRYSDEQKTARENRYKHPDKPQVPYQELLDLAATQLGGTKPQNISLLNSRQGGRQYLLPSIPPIFQKRAFGTVQLTKYDSSLFKSRAYRHKMRYKIKSLAEIIKDRRNNVSLREQRDDLLAEILMETFAIAATIQQQPAGWSEDSKLNFEQSLWLDPNNPDEDHQQDREEEDWQNAVAEQFADWLQSSLKEIFKKDSQIQSSDFGTPEYLYWKTAIEDAIKASQRLGEGVFQ
ncbi:type I-F CRISPR-associated protein Csy1 [Avibacterium sp. 21-595]|uniref:type I-F CRISPR-associated protein Csy1 n=1 Tax=Avibacterium sp. 21-595 TaxID=2911527 RepID=UPI002026E9D5|nr:type I-F CRISPR-associated protein Csy1 [Avibacterium sp. 21-595]URL06729.1 type I-F CRISPR-associated protein Csy1 [Avibacterium sp. 21-595]